MSYRISLLKIIQLEMLRFPLAQHCIPNIYFLPWLKRRGPTSSRKADKLENPHGRSGLCYSSSQGINRMGGWMVVSSLLALCTQNGTSIYMWRTIQSICSDAYLREPDIIFTHSRSPVTRGIGTKMRENSVLHMKSS